MAPNLDIYRLITAESGNIQPNNWPTFHACPSDPEYDAQSFLGLG